MLDLSTLYSLLKLLLATFLGAALGLERELSQKDASFRTFSLICLGSCLFSLLSLEAVQIAKEVNPTSSVPVEPARIAAQIVSGVGFVGGGLIFRSQSGTRGITTAVLIWVAAAIGMAVGFGRADLACLATVLALIILICFRILKDKLRELKFQNEDDDSYFRKDPVNDDE